jgi:hypothetical protein
MALSFSSSPALQLGGHLASSLPSSPSFAARVRLLFASVVHEVRFTCSWITLLLDTIVWLDEARPASTYIPPSFPWMSPVHRAAYPPRLLPLPLALSPGLLPPCEVLAPRVHHTLWCLSREGGQDIGMGKIDLSSYQLSSSILKYFSLKIPSCF